MKTIEERAEEFCENNLYDLLHRLHLDYRGLILAGLAVSVHDLPTNPMRHENQTTAPTEEGGKEKYTFPGISYLLLPL
uniref:hypothetical protein n=1 Tax=Alistipes shahii TaxID=328814 RepID=UPI00402753BC